MFSENMAENERAQNVLEENPVERHHSSRHREITADTSFLGSSDGDGARGRGNIVLFQRTAADHVHDCIEVVNC